MDEHSKEEKYLFYTIDLLKKYDISYWITDGTLLGIIREDRLLPWDGDIDIAIWKDEVNLPWLLKILEDNGYELEKILPEMDCIHLFIDGIKIDISLYQSNDIEFKIKWATFPENIIDKIMLTVTNVIFHNKYEQVSLNKYSVKNILKNIIIFISKVFTEKFKIRLFQYARKLYKYIGSVYPNNLRLFKTITFRDKDIVVPQDSEEYLRLTYGNDWKIPNKDYIWEEDTYNLKEMND